MRTRSMPAIVVLAAVVMMVPQVAHATVDMTGRWHVTDTFSPHVVDIAWDIVQTGTVLTAMSQPLGSGSIDPDSGVFQITIAGSACHDRIEGAIASDGQTFGGNYLVFEFFGVCRQFPAGLSLVGVRISTCGNHVIEPGEDCDDGNVLPGDCCSSTCHFEASGSPCGPDDANPCTDQTCDGAGTCQALNNTAPCTVNQGCLAGTCTGGVCVTQTPAPAGQPCDTDASVCTPESCDGGGTCASAPPLDCSPCGSCDPSRGCVAYGSSCAVGKGKLVLVDAAPHNKDRVSWSLQSGGQAVGFGDPLGTTDYALCIFQPPFDAAALVLRARAPAGGTCSGMPCWKVSSGGDDYSDPELTPDGVRTLRLRSTSRGEKGALLGTGLSLRLPPALPVGETLRGVLVASDGGSLRGCWRADLTPRVSTATRFVGR